MKKCRLIVMFLVVTGFCLWSSLSFAYEQYFTYPGTRAMGMAGAFIGQADDSSAVWYNPAGLMQPNGPTFDATAEYGKLPKRDNDGKYGSESNLKFVSFFIMMGVVGLLVFPTSYHIRLVWIFRCVRVRLHALLQIQLLEEWILHINNGLWHLHHCSAAVSL